jgi:hypothetical protein
MDCNSQKIVAALLAAMLGELSAKFASAEELS